MHVALVQFSSHSSLSTQHCTVEYIDRYIEYINIYLYIYLYSSLVTILYITSLIAVPPLISISPVPLKPLVLWPGWQVCDLPACQLMQFSLSSLAFSERPGLMRIENKDLSHLQCPLPCPIPVHLNYTSYSYSYSKSLFLFPVPNNPSSPSPGRLTWPWNHHIKVFSACLWLQDPPSLLTLPCWLRYISFPLFYFSIFPLFL